MEARFFNMCQRIVTNKYCQSPVSVQILMLWQYSIMSYLPDYALGQCPTYSALPNLIVSALTTKDTYIELLSMASNSSS